MSTETIGLLAGSGQLPLLAARGIQKAGYELTVVGVAGEAGRELEEAVPSLTMISVGELGRMAAHFRERGVEKLVFAGKVQKTGLFTGVEVDVELRRVLAGLTYKNDDAILGGVVDFFARSGLTVLPQTQFLGDLLLPKGILSKRAPDAREQADISFGFAMAKRIGDLDFGQRVVVKNLAVLAVEAVEGTDETIRRGGKLGHGGAVLVKTSKPRQDPRFDLPTVGLETFAAMKEAGLSVLAVEAEKTLFMDHRACLAEADTFDAAVVAVDSAGVY
jgi:DUF1009 family protein